VKTRSYANQSESGEARVAFAPFGGRYIDTVFAVGCEHAVTNSSGMNLDSFSWPAKRVSIREDTSKLGQVYSRFRHQRR
jgi:hypothetical protein